MSKKKIAKSCPYGATMKWGGDSDVVATAPTGWGFFMGSSMKTKYLMWSGTKTYPWRLVRI